MDSFCVSVETSFDPIYIINYIRSELNSTTTRKLLIFLLTVALYTYKP